MTSIARTIGDLLLTLNLNLNYGKNLFIGKESFPSEDSITIYDVGGEVQNPKLNMDFYNILIRAKYNLYEDAYDKLYEIRNQMIGRSPITINDIQFGGFWLSSDINHIGYTDKDEVIFDMRFRLLYTDISNNINRN